MACIPLLLLETNSRFPASAVYPLFVRIRGYFGHHNFFYTWSLYYWHRIGAHFSKKKLLMTMWFVSFWFDIFLVLMVFRSALTSIKSESNKKTFFDFRRSARAQETFASYFTPQNDPVIYVFANSCQILTYAFPFLV